MVAWSSAVLKNIANLNLARSVITSSKSCLNKKAINYVPVRSSGHDETIVIRDSRYQYKKFKDMLNFYILIGLIPIGLLITYVNIFIGDAKLAEIPEGYEPKHWEYYKHPISRFMARYLVRNPQEVYERNLHNVFEGGEQTQLRKLESKIRDLMSEKEDYQAWYFREPQVKYGRKTQQIMEEAEFTRRGRGPTNVI